jgi:hypothetical protein
MLKPMAIFRWSTSSTEAPTPDPRIGGGELREFLGWFVTGRLGSDKPAQPAAKILPRLRPAES